MIGWASKRPNATPDLKKSEGLFPAQSEYSIFSFNFVVKSHKFFNQLLTVNGEMERCRGGSGGIIPEEENKSTIPATRPSVELNLVKSRAIRQKHKRKGGDWLHLLGPISSKMQTDS